MDEVGKSGELQIGDTVEFQVAGVKFLARVVEDRGMIGVNGRQIVRIELLAEQTEAEPVQLEMPADELAPRQSAA